MTVLDFWYDQQARTGVYNTIQSVFEKYDLLVTPTLACPTVDNVDEGNTLSRLKSVRKQ